jgi:hypothetical protein
MNPLRSNKGLHPTVRGASLRSAPRPAVEAHAVGRSAEPRLAGRMRRSSWQPTMAVGCVLEHGQMASVLHQKIAPSGRPSAPL